MVLQCCHIDTNVILIGLFYSLGSKIRKEGQINGGISWEYFLTKSNTNIFWERFNSYF
jgi:transposase